MMMNRSVLEQSILINEEVKEGLLPGFLKPLERQSQGSTER